MTPLGMTDVDGMYHTEIFDTNQLELIGVTQLASTSPVP